MVESADGADRRQATAPDFKGAERDYGLGS